MSARRVCVVVSTVLGLGAGCASRQPVPLPRIAYAADGAVSAEVVDAPGDARYQPVPGSRYFSQLPLSENARPKYPSGLLARKLPPVTIVARLIVNGSGEVEHASIVVAANDVPAHDEPAFTDAVLSAVRTWTFIPLRRVTGKRIEPLPFTQDYRFTFRQVDGRAIVESGAAGSG